MSRCCDTGNDNYDLAVIGAGSAGFSAAITASGQGARVALLGHGTIGGSCVNVGCVPTKNLIRAAEAVHGGASLQRFDGLDGSARLSSWSALRTQKDALVHELRHAKYIDLLTDHDELDYIEGWVRLTDDGVDVDGRAISAPRIIVATGSSPSSASIDGLENVDWLDSTAALALDDLPKSMLVLGAGYIGVELAQMFARLGVEITLVCRHRVLPEAEPEIGEALASFLEEEGIRIVSGVRYREIHSHATGISLTLDINETTAVYQAEKVLLATGRTPNSNGMGLQELSVELDRRGGIVVDDRMRTSRKGIYAAGDVTGRDMFVYMAAHGAKIAALNAMNGDNRRYDDSAIPAVVFSDPQVASVGLTEATAIERGFEVKTSVLPLNQVPRALAARDTRGLIKLVADRATDRLLGTHILAPEGADSIQTATLAIRAGMTAQELGDVIFPYLTTVEGLKLAAQTFDKDVTKLSCCAG